MNNLVAMVVFHLNEEQFSLHLSDVERVIHSLEIIPLSSTPQHVAGTVNIQGEFLPVINMRKLFGLPFREVALSDHFIVVKTVSKRIVLWVDSVDEIATISDDLIEESKKIMIDSDFVEGIFKLRNGMVMINDPDKFLTTEQITKLTAQLAKQKSVTA